MIKYCKSINIVIIRCVGYLMLMKRIYEFGIDFTGIKMFLKI